MKTSFSEILSKSRLVIPIIQRDYAQGRGDDKTKRIRKDFLDAIFDILKRRINNPSSKQNLELDFVYGFSKEEKNISTFSPIDGQQRLTTLWLLSWFVAAKEKVSEMTFLGNLRYETRHSTTIFCERLLKFKPMFGFDNIEREIKDQSWYFETWDYDPGIQAMLVMLKDIEQRYADLKENSLWSLLNHNDSPFYFYKLNMEKVGLPDDLYIKMNSRGKPLTEFEYFKAHFAEIIVDPALKERFQKSIDQEWAEAIWKIIVNKRGNDNKDLALLVDSCFIRLINFITDVIGYKQGIPFSDISNLAEAKSVYQQEANLLFLFDILDSIVEVENDDPDFWDGVFYLDKSGFNASKTRLFFQNSQTDLLSKCLFTYSKQNREFSYPEQVLLYACVIHLLNRTTGFERAVRIVRNLVANSSNELRVENIGQSFYEIEAFIHSGNFDVLNHFKTEQIKEEREKYAHIISTPDVAQHIFELEDSDLLRGCISIFDLDQYFSTRKKAFLTIFDEDIVVSDFTNRANLLLCFGDYTQDDGEHTNMLAKSKPNWRTFLTTPAFNKGQLSAKTRPVLMACLDFFSEYPDFSAAQKIEEQLLRYESEPRDWKYYFLKYPGFRSNVNKGYYYWDNDNPYPLFKMKEKQFNGYHWDPFLLEVKTMAGEKGLELDNGAKMSVWVENCSLTVESKAYGFAISSASADEYSVAVLDTLIAEGILSPENGLIVNQNERGIDLEDRIERAVLFIKRLKEISGQNL